MRYAIDTETKTTVAQKVSVGLVVATAVLVLTSAIIAGIYTITHNATVRSSVIQPVSDSGDTSQVSSDRTFTTP